MIEGWTPWRLAFYLVRYMGYVWSICICFLSVDKVDFFFPSFKRTFFICANTKKNLFAVFSGT